MFEKICKRVLLVVVVLTFFSPLMVFRDLLFPFITSKAFYFRVLVELGVPFYLYLVVVNKDLRPNLKNKLNLFVLLFFIASLVSAILGVNVGRSLWGNFERMGGVFYLLHLSLLYFYIVLLGRIRADWIKKILDWLIWAMLLVTASGIFGKLFYERKPKDPNQQGWTLAVDLLKINLFGEGKIKGFFEWIADPSLPVRVSATLGNPIFLGSLLILTMFLALFLSVREDSKAKKFFYLISASMFFYGIAQSGTRGAIVGLLAAVLTGSLIFLFYYKSRKTRLVGLSIFVFLSILFFGVYSFRKALPTDSVLRRLINLKDSNSNSRLLQWQVALNGFPDRPVFGTGPENYYIISNKYYNPEIYKYDTSWFDKPHNFLLEILVTGGVIGFLTYLGMVLSVVWILFSCYKKGILNLYESLFLLCGILAYQIQNLFVFDTVSPSVAFFVFLGFIGFLSDEEKDFVRNKELKIKKQQTTESKISGYGFGYAVFSVATLFSAYGIYVGNIQGLLSAKALNYGFAYGMQNFKENPEYFKKAKTFFDTALANRFNFDYNETVAKYSEFVLNYAGNHPADVKQKDVNELLEHAEFLLKDANYKQGDNPIHWQRFASFYINKSVYTKNSQFLLAEAAIEKAKELAPNRTEPLLAELQLAIVLNNSQRALKISQQIYDISPILDNKFQLAIIMSQVGKTQEAIGFMEDLREKKYQFKSLEQISWMVNGYVTTQQYSKAMPWYELAEALKPNDINFYIGMAKNYYNAGQKDKARQVAKQIIQLDPSQVEKLTDLLSSAN